MEQVKYDALMAQLQPIVQEISKDVTLDQLENGIELLNFLVPMYGDGTGLVLFQVCLFREADLDMAQVFAVIIPETGARTQVLEKAACGWNVTSLLGSYLLCQGEGEDVSLCYRYRLILEDQETAETSLERITSAIAMAYREIAYRYESILDLTYGDQA